MFRICLYYTIFSKNTAIPKEEKTEGKPAHKNNVRNLSCISKTPKRKKNVIYFYRMGKQPHSFR